jgi:hypothetical protein
MLMTEKHEHRPIRKRDCQRVSLAGRKDRVELDAVIVLRKVRFKEYALRTNHPVLELFRDLDRSNNGRVAEAKFAGTLAITGLVFPKREMEVMREFFGDPGRPECVNYMELCRTVAGHGKDHCGLGSVLMTYCEEMEGLHRAERWTFGRLFGGC